MLTLLVNLLLRILKQKTQFDDRTDVLTVVIETG